MKREFLVKLNREFESNLLRQPVFAFRSHGGVLPENSILPPITRTTRAVWSSNYFSYDALPATILLKTSPLQRRPPSIRGNLNSSCRAVSLLRIVRRKVPTPYGLIAGIAKNG
jgi:hypothetical protein